MTTKRRRVRRWFWWQVCRTRAGQWVYWHAGHRTMGKKEKSVLGLGLWAGLWLVLVLVVACGPTSSSSAAKQHLHAAASSTAVQQDTSAAAAIVNGCLGTAHPVTCIKAQVPKAKRHALTVCLAQAAVGTAAVPGFPGTVLQTKAQACVATALKT